MAAVALALVAALATGAECPGPRRCATEEARIAQAALQPTAMRLDRPEVQPLPAGLVVSGRVAALIAGAWSAALVHELGHAAAAWGYGRRFEWPTEGEGNDPLLPLWRVKGEQQLDTAERRNIAISGFVMAAATTEATLQIPQLEKSDLFVVGHVFYTVLNSFIYVARDAWSVARGDNGVGDIRDLDRGGIPREVTYIVLLTSSAIWLARLLEDPAFLRLSFWSSSVDDNLASRPGPVSPD